MIGMINVNHPDFIACHPNLWDGDFYHPDIIPILAAIIPTYFVVSETMIRVRGFPERDILSLRTLGLGLDRFGEFFRRRRGPIFGKSGT